MAQRVWGASFRNVQAGQAHSFSSVTPKALKAFGVTWEEDPQTTHLITFALFNKVQAGHSHCEVDVVEVEGVATTGVAIPVGAAALPLPAVAVVGAFTVSSMSVGDAVAVMAGSTRVLVVEGEEAEIGKKSIEVTEVLLAIPSSFCNRCFSHSSKPVVRIGDAAKGSFRARAAA